MSDEPWIRVLSTSKKAAASASWGISGSGSVILPRPAVAKAPPMMVQTPLELLRRVEASAPPAQARPERQRAAANQPKG